MFSLFCAKVIDRLVPLVTGCRGLCGLYRSLDVCYVCAGRAVGVPDPSLRWWSCWKRCDKHRREEMTAHRRREMVPFAFSNLVGMLFAFLKPFLIWKLESLFAVFINCRATLPFWMLWLFLLWLHISQICPKWICHLHVIQKLWVFLQDRTITPLVAHLFVPSRLDYSAPAFLSSQSRSLTAEPLMGRSEGCQAAWVSSLSTRSRGKSSPGTTALILGRAAMCVCGQPVSAARTELMLFRCSSADFLLYVVSLGLCYCLVVWTHNSAPCISNLHAHVGSGSFPPKYSRSALSNIFSLLGTQGWG